MGLRVPKEKRKSTYVAAYLSCHFVFRSYRLTRLKTFEMASWMSFSCTFSLVVPVLVSLYHGFNGITHAFKPSYS